MLVGDWNICPTDDDVFDPAQFTKSTHVTPPERAAFQAFLDDGYLEVTREHAPGYTYWDYYRQRFERDRGLKIDFALASPTLAARVTGAFIDRDERDPAQGTGSPSDHAPVVVDLRLSSAGMSARDRQAATRSISSGDSTCAIASAAAPSTPACSPAADGTMRRCSVASGRDRW